MLVSAIVIPIPFLSAISNLCLSCSHLSENWATSECFNDLIIELEVTQSVIYGSFPSTSLISLSPYFPCSSSFKYKAHNLGSDEASATLCNDLISLSRLWHGCTFILHMPAHSPDSLHMHLTLQNSVMQPPLIRYSLTTCSCVLTAWLLALSVNSDHAISPDPLEFYTWTSERHHIKECCFN